MIITTEGSDEDRHRALQRLGANAYITKPIQAPQVIAKVKELLKYFRTRYVRRPRAHHAHRVFAA